MQPQPIAFPCPQCGKNMAVGAQLLGKQVRCPHCKQVIVAPASPPTSPQVTPGFQQTMNTPSVGSTLAPTTDIPTFPSFTEHREHEESILTPPVNDDLFGGEPAPKVVLPTSNTPVGNQPALIETDDPFGFNAKSPENIPTPRIEPIDESIPVTIGTTKTVSNTGVSKPSPIWIALAVYALIATGAILYLVFAGGGNDTPYLYLPDSYGEFEKADRKKLTSYNGLKRSPPKNLPETQTVRLQQKYQAGYLEVTPKEVTSNSIRLFKRDKDSNQSTEITRTTKPILVLALELKNTSKDQYFCPNDPAFQGQSTTTGSMPFNCLWIGKDPLTNGMLNWPSRERNSYDFLEGQEKDHLPLGPGESRTTIVATSARDDLRRSLSPMDAKAVLRWRLQLRCGLVQGSFADKTQEISATTLLEVHFTKDQIKG